MSWEVWEMSLRTWCFNRGIARSLLRRFWLLWAAYFAVLLFLFPVMLMSRVHGIYDRDLYFNYTALNTVQPCVMVTVAAALLSVMAAFGWLYSPRQSNLMASLPISRPSLFLTSAAVSLGMCLGAVLLTALLTLSVAVPTGQVQAWAVGQWLLTVSLACVGYFGFALFCAMLTGNLVVLPVLFVLLGCGVVVAESCMRHLMGYFIFGMPVAAEKLVAFSPLAAIFTGFRVAGVTDELGVAVPDSYVLSGGGLMAAYALCGLVLGALALLLFRRRAMERAGDTVAFDLLRPLFRLCMALGCALVLPSAVFNWLFNHTIFGTAAAVLLAVLSCLGAFAGWYAAEMIMHKTLNVFFRDWKRLSLLCAAILLFFAAGESDLLGFERHVPSPDEIESVTFNGLSLTEEDNLARMCTLHESIVSHKAVHEHAAQGESFVFSYQLKNGGTLMRSYRLALTRDEVLDPRSDLNGVNALFRTREALELLTLRNFPLDDVRITGGMIEAQTAERHESIALSAEEAEALLREAVLPDLEEGCLDAQYRYYWPDLDYYTHGSLVNLYFNAVSKSAPDKQYMGVAVPENYYLGVAVRTDSRCTVPYLREHYGIEVLPNGVINPPGEYDLLYGLEFDYDS